MTGPLLPMDLYPFQSWHDAAPILLTDQSDRYPVKEFDRHQMRHALRQKGPRPNNHKDELSPPAVLQCTKLACIRFLPVPRTLMSSLIRLLVVDTEWKLKATLLSLHLFC